MPTKWKTCLTSNEPTSYDGSYHKSSWEGPFDDPLSLSHEGSETPAFIFKYCFEQNTVKITI